MRPRYRYPWELIPLAHELTRTPTIEETCDRARALTIEEFNERVLGPALDRHFPQAKESPVNLKQNELLQLIALQSRDLATMVEARMHHGSYGGDDRGSGGQKLSATIRERVARIEQLSAELE